MEGKMKLKSSKIILVVMLFALPVLAFSLDDTYSMEEDLLNKGIGVNENGYFMILREFNKV